MNVTAERVAQAMRLRGIDQSELALAVGATQGAISKIVVGKTTNSRLIPKIAGQLGVPIAWLLGQSDDLDEAEVGALLSFEEQAWLEMLRGLDPNDRKAVLTLTRSLATSAKVATLQAPKAPFRPAEPHVHEARLAG